MYGFSWVISKWVAAVSPSWNSPWFPPRNEPERSVMLDLERKEVIKECAQQRTINIKYRCNTEKKGTILKYQVRNCDKLLACGCFDRNVAGRNCCNQNQPKEKTRIKPYGLRSLHVRTWKTFILTNNKAIVMWSATSASIYTLFEAGQFCTLPDSHIPVVYCLACDFDWRLPGLLHKHRDLQGRAEPLDGDDLRRCVEPGQHHRHGKSIAPRASS